MKKKTKVIFLDIDGVMVTDRSMMRYLTIKEANKQITESVMFDSDALQNLEVLVNASGADIVITSQWRFSKSIKKIISLFEEAKFRYTSRIQETVVHFADPQIPRITEIKEYLKDFEEEIEEWAVIDDAELADPQFPELKERFVRTNPRGGLDLKAATKALMILNGWRA